MTPDDNKLVATSANRKDAKGSRGRKGTAVVASVNRSTKDKDLYNDSDGETGHDTEYVAPSRLSPRSADAFTDDGAENAFRHPLPNRFIEASTRPKGKGRHKILVPGTPEPDDTEKRPADLSLEERCYQELLNIRCEVSPTSETY
jgi:hypothetical protein